MTSCSDNLFFGQEHPSLNDIDKQKCEGLLTEKECLEALKTMEPGKSPGTDGLPAEFYKVFWKDVSPFLIRCLNKSHQKGKLALTQRRGIISLIPKKDKALQELKNWRPITLLNCDYKIASKAIASRLKAVLQNLVDNDQTGFLKGRSIAENICLINNVISYTESKNIPGLLLFVDFEKAFDTIEWAFVEKTLHHFGFGSSLIKWINLFYRDIQSCVINNGWSAGFFELSRGVRQGCPLSPYIFILCAEVLATTIRKDNVVKGITVGSTECKLSQYADDTTLILDGTQKSLERSFAILEKFGEASGLRVNCEKTEALWIGSKKGSNQIICSDKNLKWADGKVKALGVWFCIDCEESKKKNYEEKVHKVEDILNNWRNKRLTLIGKIAVIKALAASQFVYILSSTTSCSKSLKETNNLLFKFLWDNKGDKIKRTEMIADYQDGGQKMLDIIEFNKALKISWILKYISNDCKSKWKCFFDFHLSKVGGKLVFLGNLAPKDARKLNIEDDFIQELIELWTDLNYRDSFASQANFSAGYIWNNSMIRIAGKTIFYKHWANAGVMKINDLMTSDSRIISYSCFKDRFCFPVSFLEFCGVTSAVRSATRSLKLTLPGEKILENVLLKLNSSNKPSQAAYKILITKKCTRPEKSQKKWIRDCELVDVESLDWESIYLLPRICTLSTKLRNFQFKFLHRRIATNSFLFKIKLSESNLCCFCQTEQETLLHLFWECPITEAFWNSVQQFFVSVDLIPASQVLTLCQCLGLKGEKSALLFNHCLLLGRFYIYSCKYKNVRPSTIEYVNQVRCNLRIEKHVSIITGTQNAFQQKWHKILQSL